MTTLSLLREGNRLANATNQLQVLQPKPGQKPFEQALEESGLYPLRAAGIEILQVSVGKLCNMTCEHCHVDAGPDRREIMTRETAEACIQALAQTDIPTLDLTGGAPEMNPNFRWIVEETRRLGRHVIDRCNLTILRASGYTELPEFLAAHQVEIVASLPCYLEENVDAQRGNYAFRRSIEVLQRLNRLGYGRTDSGLQLTLVYNPIGPALPPPQDSLEEAYRRELAARYDVSFTRLITITNMPISRFLNQLIKSGKYDEYMDKLIAAYNPAAAAGSCAGRRYRSIGKGGFTIATSTKCSGSRSAGACRKTYTTSIRPHLPNDSSSPDSIATVAPPGPAPAAGARLPDSGSFLWPPMNTVKETRDRCLTFRNHPANLAVLYD